jgi:hypothetical protein
MRICHENLRRNFGLRGTEALFDTEPLAGRLWIVENDRIRIRGED